MFQPESPQTTEVIVASDEAFEKLIKLLSNWPNQESEKWSRLLQSPSRLRTS